MKWYEKTWEWIKKYWGVVLSAVALAVGSKAMSIDSGTTAGVKETTYTVPANFGAQTITITGSRSNAGRCLTLDAGKVLVQSKDGYKVGEYLHYESVCAMPVTIENCLSREISVKISKPQVPSEWKTIPPLSSITITEDTP